ncbi:MAG: DUF4159 domain-containing protein [Verrucomicrobiae bacterium]|nr:DUF4159 domain-containing protein [Verrucomicrobiae bacterium]
MRPSLLTLLLLVLMAGVVLGQRRSGRWFGEGRGGDTARTARELESHSTGTPMWHNPPGFEHDVFTFARVRYRNYGPDGHGWRVDLPDADLNLSYRLQQMTSIRADPHGRIIDLTDPDLPNYPFLYIVEPGGLWLDDAEIVALRQHLLNGAFLMLDDFWGELAWENAAHVMRQVLPDREFQELSLDHELYQRPFRITSKGQVPNVGLGIQSQYHGRTWERPDAREVHHRAILDDRGRIMVLATHNTDNGDGWEREGEDNYFFREFSEKIAYPLGINIIFHVMTH